MTNQSREAFEKWAGVELNGSEDRETNWMWMAWQAALSEGRRLGLEEAARCVEASAGHADHAMMRQWFVDAIRALMVKKGKV